MIKWKRSPVISISSLEQSFFPPILLFNDPPYVSYIDFPIIKINGFFFNFLIRHYFLLLCIIFLTDTNFWVYVPFFLSSMVIGLHIFVYILGAQLSTYVFKETRMKQCTFFNRAIEPYWVVTLLVAEQYTACQIRWWFLLQRGMQFQTLPESIFSLLGLLYV